MTNRYLEEMAIAVEANHIKWLTTLIALHYSTLLGKTGQSDRRIEIDNLMDTAELCSFTAAKLRGDLRRD